MGSRGQTSAFSGVDTSVPVVVLKLVADNYAHGRLAVTRSLGRLGVPAYAITEGRRSPAALSRFAHEQIVWPIERPPSLATLTDLLELGARIGNRPVLIVSDDVGAMFVDDHADELRPVFRFPEQPRGLPERLSDKSELTRLCAEYEVPTPEVTFPQSRDEAEALARQMGYPVVLKAMDSRVLAQRPNARSVLITRTPAQLLDAYDLMEDPSAPNYMLQEYIPGGPESIWMFNGYFDEHSECRVAFTGQKIRQYPRGTGSTTLGICHDNPVIVASTRALMKGIGYRGIVDMGYRYDERDGRYKLLDVNPRLGSTFRLFVDEHGLDVARALYLDLTGQPIPAQGASEGRRWWVEPFDLWVRRDYRREDGLTWRRWFASLKGADEAAWFARDDLRPFLAMAGLFVTQPAYRRITRSGGGEVVRRAARRLQGRRSST